MPDYLTCGICGIDYELNDISQFITHKATCGYTTNSRNHIPFPSKNILECVKCFRKFNTPWSVLLHIQLDHKLNIVRNLCLPEDRSTSYNPTHYSSGNQQQFNAATQRSLTLRTVETQTRTTSVQKAKCMAICCQETSSGDCNTQCCTGCDKEGCTCSTKPTCCLPSDIESESCQSSQTVSCCPCPRTIKAETKSADCQTDFEYLDFDMDFLLDDGQDISGSVTNLQQDQPILSSQAMSMDVNLSTSGNIDLSNQYDMSTYASASQLISSEISMPSGMQTESSILTTSPSQLLRTSATPIIWSENSLVNTMNEENSVTIIETQIDTPIFQSLSTTSAPVSTIGMSQNSHYSFADSEQQQILDQTVSTSSSFQTNITRPLTTSTNIGGQQRRMREYRFNCAQCGKLFRQNVHLRKHTMSQHTKVKPHLCPHCGYTTVEKSHLTVHIRTHTGEKPYRCRNCNYSSAQNCTLKSHYLRRHPGSSVICPSCGEGYITEQERNNHQKACKEITSIQ